MKLSDFDYTLPEQLIARYPLPERSASRLLCLDGATGALAHRQFTDIVDLLSERDLLVFNNTRVLAARLFAQKSTGGKVEVLIERVVDPQHAIAQVRASKSPKAGTVLQLEAGGEVTVTGRLGEFYQLQTDNDWFALMAEQGHMPLPPYFERDDEKADEERYQTVYAKQPGAVAAPTAGLHFDQPLLQCLRDKGVRMAEVTLHVGAGTFQPVRVEDIREHQMHSEWYQLNDEVVQAVAETKASGGRVIAVGTTSVRTLESASRSGHLESGASDTNIFIYPGYRFRIVDAMITNFHLPQSTLLMLVSAFSGRDHILNAYHEAIAREYRFFSYGDAMFLTPGANA
ncbi:tRNA preQ1(34) S-adenosylmethionine ribosyltransferase-isomerase QueA [Permianibacter aggregans]|nr:tRNA preQ1(34) S-adenosylmethionine ribosyltransferase-isomerase QueA [Permianibacter aggregans]QGX41683.1 tRNA preQ1(34) S-adenosylmethionine ribosyltransferase-isomerase QueA [Permianibacter aggregans]